MGQPGSCVRSTRHRPVRGPSARQRVRGPGIERGRWRRSDRRGLRASGAGSRGCASGRGRCQSGMLCHRGVAVGPSGAGDRSRRKRWDCVGQCGERSDRRGQFAAPRVVVRGGDRELPGVRRGERSPASERDAGGVRAIRDGCGPRVRAASAAGRAGDPGDGDHSAGRADRGSAGVLEGALRGGAVRRDQCGAAVAARRRASERRPHLGLRGGGRAPADADRDRRDRQSAQGCGWAGPAERQPPAGIRGDDGVTRRERVGIGGDRHGYRRGNHDRAAARREDRRARAHRSASAGGAGASHRGVRPAAS